MNDEIKEILDYFKKYMSIDECIRLSKIEDYITNLQEQLHKASLDIQELTERDLYCPTSCDKLTNLQERFDALLEAHKICDELESEYQERNEKTVEKLQFLIDVGFDYDGYNTVDSLKSLIDELVSYAKESIDILEGSDKE